MGFPPDEPNERSPLIKPIVDMFHDFKAWRVRKQEEKEQLEAFHAKNKGGKPRLLSISEARDKNDDSDDDDDDEDEKPSKSKNKS